MARSMQRLLLIIIIACLFNIKPSTQDKSVSDISGMGWQFVPADSSHPPILTCTTKNILYCSLECNERVDCRTFDYDIDSQQCRLWDCDTTTGSIVASPTKPRSSVGTIRLSSSLYANINNQSCDKCAQSRYETCDTSSNTCQCPLKTFWNGSICSAQLLRNQICSQVNTCRSDLNLTCEPSCDLTYRCSTPPSIGVGQTVAGFCNSSTGNGSSGLKGPWGIYLSPSDGILYVTDYDLNRFQAFSPFSRIGSTLTSTTFAQADDIFVDSSGTIYMVDGSAHGGTVYVQRTGMNITSFPAAGMSTTSCSLTGLYSAYGVVVDGSGNIYVSSYTCCMVVKWAVNATTGVLVAGVTGNYNSIYTQFGYFRFIHLDEARGVIYVCDEGNNRIQKFTIGGNGTGVTVAGNSVAGTGLNQLNSPAGIWVTNDGQTLYIADYTNNRVMKWNIGATQGSVVVGSASGVAGNTNQLLKGPGDVTLDPTETYLYVSDYGNHRIQQFRLK